MISVVIYYEECVSISACKPIVYSSWAGVKDLNYAIGPVLAFGKNTTIVEVENRKRCGLNFNRKCDFSVSVGR